MRTCLPFPLSVRFRPAVLAAAVILVLAVGLLTGCDDSATTTATTGATGTTPTQTATVPPYQRQTLKFFKGIAEPDLGAWDNMNAESERLKEDGFNTVTLSPPVLITSRAGGQPRVIMEGQAASAESLVEKFHEHGLAVYLAPTTRVSGFSEPVDPTVANLDHLREDALRWAEKAEEGQAELFAPLSRYNLVLGNTAADAWSQSILPDIRARYHGLLAAEAIPDLAGPPASGAPHDFERLDFKGYDYLLLDLFPQGESYDNDTYLQYVTEVLARAQEVARRDGLKGVMVGQFGSWREPAGVDMVDGPLLGDTGQAEMADAFLQIALPQTKGVFFYGWTLPGRGARDFPVEHILKRYFTVP